ncbi:MAG: 2-C-methyl-D-erythritol 2,4-cyclodiphosphate synthase [Thermodesulfobacteriota bacterium]
MNLRVGHGYDAHRWVEGRPLVLGGVDIPHHRGLLGHSDADVILHAICDAILGASALGDLGSHFSDTDPEYAGISSLILLERTAQMARGRGWEVVNVDATVIAQSPRLAPHIPRMVDEIADTLGLHSSQVNLKATTTEGMGFVGREEGIAAHAVVLLREITKDKA